MQYLTIADVMDRLAVTRITVRGLIKRGELEAVKLGDARNAGVRISEDSLRAYIDRRRVQPEKAG